MAKHGAFGCLAHFPERGRYQRASHDDHMKQGTMDGTLALKLQVKSALRQLAASSKDKITERSLATHNIHKHINIDYPSG